MTMQQYRTPNFRLLSVLSALLVGCLFHASLCWGWGNDSNENTAVFTPQPAAATTPHIVTDGWGGAFITVGSSDGPVSTGIYTQRLDANGSVHTGWSAAGSVQAVTGQEESSSMSDGAGGLYVVWEDYRADGANGDIYAQRYDANGSIHTGWPAGGLAVCTAADDQSFPQITTDGAGGAFIVWQDLRSGSNYDIYAQRIDAAGAVHAGWPTNGVAVSVSGSEKLVPSLISDGANGAIIAWEDYRNGVDADIYARRIGPDGALLWAGEVGVSAATNDQVNPIAVTDGAGGTIIVWEDYRNDPLGNGESLDGIANIYAQRLDSAGAIVAGGNWVADGIPVAEAAVDQQTPQMISNGSGGAFVVWSDDGASGKVNYQIWAQQLAGDGTTTVSGGAAASQTLSGSLKQRNPQLAVDGAGGIIVAWEDDRNSAGTGIDIYAQRVDSTLTPVWTNDSAVTSADFDQLTPQLVSDSSGGAIVTWNDFRSNTSAEIFAQRINGDGTLSTFTTPSYDVTFVAGANGSLTGPAVQTIISGQSTVPVTAVPATNYSLSNWTGTGGFVTTTDNPLTVANVTAPQTITANFVATIFTVAFTAGPNGSLTGTATQPVSPGGSTTAVTAVPATGYHFVNWTGDNGFVTTTANPLTVNPATASQNITANFAINTDTIAFATNTTGGGTNGGTLTGTTSQPVGYGASTSAVTAAPNPGYRFTGWTGDNGFTATTTNPLTVTNTLATANLTQTVTANFAKIDGIITGGAAVSVADALRLLKIVTHQIAATPDDMIHADIAPLDGSGKPKGDGVLDLYDVIGLLRMVAGLI